MQDTSFVEYLQESMYDSPLKTAIMDLYALCEAGMDNRSVIIPAQHRPLLAKKFNDAILKNRITFHAKTGSFRYKIQHNKKLSESHARAESMIMNARKTHTPLDIVPVLYQQGRYIAFVKCDDGSLLQLVTMYASYPPQNNTSIMIKTYFIVSPSAKNELYTYLMDNPNATTLPDHLHAIVERNSNGGLKTIEDPENPYKYHDMLAQIQQEQDPIKQTIDEYSRQLHQLKKDIETLQTDPSKKAQLADVRNQYHNIVTKYNALGNRSIQYKKQINALADKYRETFNQDLINDNIFIRFGKKLRWYEPQQPANQEHSTTDAAE